MQYRVPRGKIPWFPKIDLDACIGDKECVNFCKNDVFVWDELKDRPEVIRPLNCVVGCDACSHRDSTTSWAMCCRYGSPMRRRAGRVVPGSCAMNAAI